MCSPLAVLGCSFVRCQIFGQFDGTIIKTVQLLHNEAEVRGEVRSCCETPEEGRDIHEDGQKEQDVRKELRMSENKC